MAYHEQPLALGGIHREFEAHVLEGLKKHAAKMHGCPVLKVESKLDGSLAIWFRGWRPGLPQGAEWEGALRWNLPFLQDKKWFGDVNACVEGTLQILDEITLNDAGPMLIRAKG